MMNNETQTQYLKLLSRSFPTIADASKEIINLKAILNLPKGTEHFLADIHGESEAFQHILKKASADKEFRMRHRQLVSRYYPSTCKRLQGCF